LEKFGFVRLNPINSSYSWRAVGFSWTDRFQLCGFNTGYKCYHQEKGSKERYVGVHQKPRKKPNLVIADVISRLESFSPEMIEYIEQVRQHKPGTWRHHLRNLLALKVNYRVEDILVAVRRAWQYKVFESGAIERFLEKNSEPR
jgi:hypothetical protein